MADAGNVTIRFSVQDAEVVRKALEQLGKDGEGALKKIDAAGQPPSGGLRALNAVIGDLNSRAVGLVAPLGGVGQGLVQLGPAGFLAAAALGGVIALFERVREGAKAFGQFSRDIRDQSEAAGLSASQYQALVAQLQQYGLEQEKASTALSRFAVHREEAARGSGELYNALRRENSALAEQFAAARTSEQALNIFAQAIANAEMKTRAFLLNAAFGRGAELIGAALIDLAGKGGVGAVTEAMTKAGAVADETFIQRSAAAAVAAQQKAQLVERAWNQAYAAIYEAWKDFKKTIGLGPDNEIKIALAVRTYFTGDPAGERTPDEEAQQIRDRIATLRAGGNRIRNRPRAVSIEDEIAGLERRLEEVARRARGDLVGPRQPEGPPAPTAEDLAESQKARQKESRDALERSVKIERERLGLLGETAPVIDTITAKENELTLARANGADISDDEARRIVANYVIQKNAAELAARIQAGIAREDEIIVQRTEEVYEKRTRNIVKSDQELATAEAIVRKEALATAESLRVRSSETPALTKLAIDADKLKLNLDQGLSSALQSSTSDLLEMAKGTQTLSQGLSNLSARLLEAVANAMLMKSVVGPISSALSGGLSSLLPSARGNAFDAGALMPFATGGIVTRPTLFRFAGGTGLMGEAGPEAIVPLRRGPDGALGVGATGSQVNVNIRNYGAQVTATKSTDNQGRPSVDIEVRRMVQDLGERLLSDRGSPWHRALSRTIGSNPATTVG